jgi:glutamine synthetase
LDLGLCPRRALTTIVHHAAQSFNLRFRVGFEVEFEVFRREIPSSTPPHSNSSLTPASTSLGRFAVDGLRADIYPIIEETVHHLLDAGVGIQTMQTEGRRGQYELSLAPRAPLEAVDELVFVHDTLKQELARHGLIATMAPRPVASRRQATGQHTHISISRTEVAPEFLAGILGRLPGLCAVCMPFEVSYERVQPYLGGEVVAWGMEDRTVPVRGIEEGHWELRCVDATANMYLALASVLGAGLLGVENEETMRWADSTRERPRENGVAGLQLNGIPEKSNGYHGGKANGVMAAEPVPLPRTLDAALDLLEKEVVQLGQVMDSSALEHFLRVKRFERDSLDRKDPEDVRTMLSELF